MVPGSVIEDSGLTYGPGVVSFLHNFGCTFIGNKKVFFGVTMFGDRAVNQLRREFYCLFLIKALLALTSAY